MKIGFLGAGKMGLPILCNIARKLGQPVVVHDPRPLALPEQAADVAHLLQYSADLNGLEACDIVVLCLPDSKVVSAVIEGSARGQGLMDMLKTGAMILDCSSSIPAETLRLGAALSERGIALHDAPVSGGLARAWAADLTVMAGGIPDGSPLLTVLQFFASKIVRLDRVGDGHVMKTANNYLLAANIISFTEAMRFARTAGISFDKFGEVVNSSSGGSYVSANKIEALRRDDDSVSFTTALIAKDVRNFMESCQAVELDLPLLPHIQTLWDEALKQLGGEVDSMKIYHMMGSRLPA